MPPSDRQRAAAIARIVVGYFRRHARDLPWRHTRDPYPIWVSELMLQQTRVTTVIPYYRRWLERFPTVEALAEAPLDDVLAAWSGLGYYARARNLHRAAHAIVTEHGGAWPPTAAELRRLPGIGPYTAGAIASIAFGEPVAAVDGNVARLLARLYRVDTAPTAAATRARLWRLAQSLVPERAPGDFNQGAMELGGGVCTPRQPACDRCPLRRHCQAHAAGDQDRLPRKAAADRARPVLRSTAVWLQRGDRILLGRRPPGGLYGGLWELPQADDDTALAALLGDRVALSEPELTHRQTLTHRELEIRVVRGTARRTRFAAEPYQELAWHPIPRLLATSGLGIATATRRIARAMVEPESD